MRVQGSKKDRARITDVCTTESTNTEFKTTLPTLNTVRKTKRADSDAQRRLKANRNTKTSLNSNLNPAMK